MAEKKKRGYPDTLVPAQKVGDVPMAEKPLCVRIRKDADSAIRALSNRSEWLRAAIEDAAIADGLIDPNTPQSDEP